MQTFVEDIVEAFLLATFPEMSGPGQSAGPPVRPEIRFSQSESHWTYQNAQGHSSISYRVEYLNEVSEQTVYSREVDMPVSTSENSAADPIAMTAVDVRQTWLTHGAAELNIHSSEEGKPEFRVEQASESALPQAIEDARPHRATSSGEDTTLRNQQAECAMVSMDENSQQASNRRPDQADKREQIRLPPFSRASLSYIEITSPAVLEALRSVVDYYPEYDFRTKRLKIHWPYPILTHVRDALTRYRDLFSSESCDATNPFCFNRLAYKHIGVVQDFVQEKVGHLVAIEKERHKRGYATFEMLWLLYEPGTDVYVDFLFLGEWQPHVLKKIEYTGFNDTITNLKVHYWNMHADSVNIGPCDWNLDIPSFSGEKKITSLVVYPCSYFEMNSEGKNADEVREHFTERGKMFLQLRKKACWWFDGYEGKFPRRPVSNHDTS